MSFPRIKTRKSAGCGKILFPQQKKNDAGRVIYDLMPEPYCTVKPADFTLENQLAVGVPEKQVNPVVTAPNGSYPEPDFDDEFVEAEENPNI